MSEMSLSNQHEIDAHKKNRKSKILQSYNVPVDPKAATPITKAEFSEQYPEAEYEKYSIEAIDKFRKELVKSQPDTADDTFSKATSDLKSFILNENGKQIAIFVRKKEKGE